MFYSRKTNNSRLDKHASACNWFVCLSEEEAYIRETWLRCAVCVCAHESPENRVQHVIDIGLLLHHHWHMLFAVSELQIPETVLHNSGCG